ncbi:MAG: DUF4424 family protein [Paracoccus sp. (in: a-proteobacteria)]|uniref:DUF4424 family protein n=1 Tax=Paracoccus sp. TaxID=267 RepID=UPI0026DF7CF3|nr:DUF4424 family protein [Paracoccus sp. (in: a-proteobacteria)]MDO5621162.1 DUF4424 family protein [Paracoccus sp. (in: a-proteobacteria)]
MLRLAALLMLTATPALANDSMAGLPASGLVLHTTDDVEMRSEVLHIASDRVTVDYVFHNHSAADIPTIVAFPLPDLDVDFYGPDRAGMLDDPGHMDFTVTVGGNPVTPNLQSRALLAGVDVTERLTALRIPINPLEAAPVLAALPADQRVQIRDLVMPDGEPRWLLSRAWWWNQTFPAGRDLAVHHSYKPDPTLSIAGGTYRADDPHYADVCIDDSFHNAARRMFPDGSGGIETRLDYILTTGANWRGPIGDFTLIVDKPTPDSLVSFCGSGVEKISPTRFQMRLQDFTPSRDLSVMWLTKYAPE